MYNLLLDKVDGMSKEDRVECLSILEKEECKLEAELEFIEEIKQDIFMLDRKDEY